MVYFIKECNPIFIIIDMLNKKLSDKLYIKGQLLSHHDSLCVGHRMRYKKNNKNKQNSDME